MYVQKTEVIYYVLDQDAAPSDWKMKFAHWLLSKQQSMEMSQSESQRAPVAVSQTSSCKKQTSCMHAPCHHPQTEFALLRGTPGVSRINHILRVHGHTMGKGHATDSFPMFTEDNTEQAALSAGQSGSSYKMSTSELSLQPNHGFST